jgi:hypothetical protein
MTKFKTISVLLAIGLMWVGGYLLAHAGEAPAGQTTSTDAASVSGDSVAAVPHKVVAYYFHGNVRCATCRKIEAYTGEAIDSGFAAELKSGLLEWHAINTDSSQNEHYLEDYQLYTKSVILSDLHHGKQTRWKNLDKIWTLTGDKSDFMKYIQDEVRILLDSTK